MLFYQRAHSDVKVSSKKYSKALKNIPQLYTSCLG